MDVAGRAVWVVRHHDLHPMDNAKRRALKTELLAHSEPRIVVMEHFFDGNDDLGSIGCNLVRHPGIDRFREIFANLLRRPDVEAAYARIYEIDPGPDFWPFTDTVFIVGSISTAELRYVLSPLEPTEVASGSDYSIPPQITAKHRAPVLAAWWD